jgi:hypothetical protein
MDDRRDVEDLHRLLGELISRESPYGQIQSVGSDQDSSVVRTTQYGLLAEHNADHPVSAQRVLPESLTPEMLDNVLDWEIGGRRVPVLKAMRIPYTFVSDDGRVMISHLVVGHEAPEEDEASTSAEYGEVMEEEEEFDDDGDVA